MSIIKQHSEMVQDLKSDDYDSINYRIVNNSDSVDLLHAALGITTEGGEVSDQLKRHYFYGTELDLTNLKEEIGDLMWYIQLACTAGGFTLDEALETNIAKLRKRYGEKFSEDAAINRDTESEREVLEQSVGAWLCGFTQRPLIDSDMVEVEWVSAKEFIENTVGYADSFAWDNNGTEKHPLVGDIIRWRYVEQNG